jgi:hypothetical protein
LLANCITQDSSDEDEESKAERLESVRDKLNRHRRNFWSKGRKKMPVDKDAGGEDMDKMYHDELTKEERERTCVSLFCNNCFYKCAVKNRAMNRNN